MNCHSVRHTISAFVDGVIAPDKEQEVSAHLSSCTECALVRDQLLQLRAALRKLPAASPPAYLTTVLRVVASRERVRRLENTGLRAALAAWAVRGQLWIDNLMRPLALPLAGGLISAVLLLGMLVPTFYVRKDGTIKDIPFATDAAMKTMSPFGFVDEDITVVVTIDEQGRMVDYSVPGEEGFLKDPELRRGIENALLFSEFTPARNALGQPITGPIRLYLRRSQVIDRVIVKG